MKKILYSKWNRAEERDKLVVDLKDSLGEYFGSEWRILQTPIIIDIDLVDILLVNNTGRLCAVTILPEKVDSSLIGKIVSEYAALSRQLEKFKNAYAGENIDVKQKLMVRLFVPNNIVNILELLACISIPIEVYQYFFIKSHDNEGIVIERLSELVERREGEQDFSSLLKIMGENVRSEASSVSEEEAVLKEKIETKEEEPAAESVHEESVPSENETKQKHNTDNYFERTKLNEDELVAFFDLERRLAAFQTEKMQ